MFLTILAWIDRLADSAWCPCLRSNSRRSRKTTLPGEYTNDLHIVTLKQSGDVNTTETYPRLFSSQEVQAVLDIAPVDDPDTLCFLEHSFPWQSCKMCEQVTPGKSMSSLDTQTWPRLQAFKSKLLSVDVHMKNREILDVTDELVPWHMPGNQLDLTWICYICKISRRDVAYIDYQVIESGAIVKKATLPITFRGT